MAELEIKGKPKYIKYLSKHLKKEHPSTKKRMKIELNNKKINPMNTRSNKQLLMGHSLLHRWWNNPKSTSWTRTQIRKEHARLVKIMLKRGFNHNSPLR